MVSHYYDSEQGATSRDPLASSVALREQEASVRSPVSARHRSLKRREELVELQELKKQKLILEYLKLELRPGPMTREECTEQERRATEMIK